MITTDYLEIGPAYGRDYKSTKEVKAAFEQGADFEMLSIMHGVDAHGTYCSRRDFKVGTKVILRYKGMTMTAVATA